VHIACRFGKNVAEEIPQKSRRAYSAEMLRSRFRKKVAEEIPPKYSEACSLSVLSEKCSSPILYNEELSIGDALITRFVPDYRIRVYINQSRDCRFFLASK